VIDGDILDFVNFDDIRFVKNIDCFAGSLLDSIPAVFVADKSVFREPRRHESFYRLLCELWKFLSQSLLLALSKPPTKVMYLRRRAEYRDWALYEYEIEVILQVSRLLIF